jgi:hypothetical protein
MLNRNDAMEMIYIDSLRCRLAFMSISISVEICYYTNVDINGKPLGT